MGRDNKFFVSLDLAKGYWQFSIKPEDGYKTSFTFDKTTYCFKRLPFGLKNSGDIFCRSIASILNEIKNKSTIKNYVDDILVHSKTFNGYYNSLTEILQLLRKYNLKLNAKNVYF
jgi:hypothetical protein